LTGRAKGRLALLVLAAIVVGGGAFLTMSPSVRVRYWSSRMRSGDPAARKHARERLLAIGRPSVDRVYAELVAGEVCDTIAAVPSSIAFVGRRLRPRSPVFMVTASFGTSSGTLRVGEEVTIFTLSLVPRIGRESSDPASHQLVVSDGGPRDPTAPGWTMPYDYRAAPIVNLPAEDPLSPAIIEETKLRLDGAR
jgi:hypothetical protein